MAYIGTIEEKNKSATSGRRLKTSVQTTQPTIPPIQTSGFSVNVPNTIPSSVLGSNISSGQISNVFNNYLAQQQELMGQITANSVASPEEAAVRNALTNFDQSYRLGMDKIENKPIAMPFITGQQAALQRQAAIERQGLAETYSALSSDRKAKVDALQNQFSMLSNLYGTSVDAIKTQAEFDQLAREAEKIDTSIVKLDNGNTLLIDNQTGKVVKNFGGAEGAGGFSAGNMGADPMRDLSSLAQNIAVDIPQKAQRDIFLQNVNRYSQNGDEVGLKDYIFKTVVNYSVPTADRSKTLNRFLMLKGITGLNDSLKEYYASGGQTNILAGTKDEVLRKLGTVSDPKLREIATKIGGFVDEIARYRSGAALTESEERFYKKITPSIFRGKTANQAAINGLQGSLYDFINGTVGFALGSQGLDTFLQTSGGLYSGGYTEQPNTAQPPEDDPLGIF